MAENIEQTPCVVCKKPFEDALLLPLELIREETRKLIHDDHPEITKDGAICREDLAAYYAKWVQNYLTEQQKNPDLALSIAYSLENYTLISKDVVKEEEEKITFGEKVADKIAQFGGSWKFIISFGVFLMIWIIINTIFVLTHVFDEYPFILLNLILSCLAALQAPVIMMSQNRVEARDRARAEHDYEVNLKAEMEIRHLHDKIDFMQNALWKKMENIEENFKK